MARKRSNKKNKKADKQRPPLSTPEVEGVLLLAFASILFLSLISFSFAPAKINWLGAAGDRLGWLFHALLGLGSYIFTLYLAWIGYRLFFNKLIEAPWVKAFWVMLMTGSFCLLLSLIEERYPFLADSIGTTLYPELWTRRIRYHLGGAPFYYIYRDLPGLNLQRSFNTAGVIIICTGGITASILYLTKISPITILRKVRECLEKVTWPEWKWPQAVEQTPSTQEAQRFVKLRIPQTNTGQQTEHLLPHKHELMEIQPEKNLKVRPSLSRKEVTGPPSLIKIDAQPLPVPPSLPPHPQAQPQLQPLAIRSTSEKRRDAALTAQSIHNGDFTKFELPSSQLLTNARKVDQSSLKKDLKKQAEVLEETLLSFGIEAKVGQINCGPTITSFEVHPAIGVKVQKIRALENDIALNMEATSIRIIAPIPGKAAVGIEVPNAVAQEVSFKEMLQAYQQTDKKFHIPVLLGKAVNGDYVMSDLAKMPHCIIAGATGSGKSVCINTIVMSILLNAKPDEIKLIMVDPKKVELTPYTRLPHMLAPVITEPQGACAALNWMVKEMERRYEILKLVGTRNIDSFNTRKIDAELEKTLNQEIPAKMPYIVGIIDELADLMMVASSDIETPIARIAQMARAVGIHLVLATQRPSREVITGLIKANFPTRISFKVASRINSQIVLDETGAESLLGNGDMLFLPPGSSHLTRAQGAFIRDEDIQAVVKKICDQAPPDYVIESFDRMARGIIDDSEHSEAPADSLYDQALDIILSTGNASTTFLQRKLKVGYARAASLIDELEKRGIVGPAEGSKARKILAPLKGAEKEPEISEDLLEDMDFEAAMQAEIE